MRRAGSSSGAEPGVELLKLQHAMQRRQSASGYGTEELRKLLKKVSGCVHASPVDPYPFSADPINAPAPRPHSPGAAQTRSS